MNLQLVYLCFKSVKKWKHILQKNLKWLKKKKKKTEKEKFPTARVDPGSTAWKVYFR